MLESIIVIDGRASVYGEEHRMILTRTKNVTRVLCSCRHPSDSVGVVEQYGDTSASASARPSALDLFRIHIVQERIKREADRVNG